MNKTKHFFWKVLGSILTVLSIVFMASSGVTMAEAAALPDAGKTDSGAGVAQDGKGGGPGKSGEGAATLTSSMRDGDPNFVMDDVDKKIIKIRPMATPLDQISRHANAQAADSFEIKYYSVGTRPISCEVATSANFTQMSGVDMKELKVTDSKMFTLDDTIRVVGVKGITEPVSGKTYTDLKMDAPDLMLCVCGRSENGMPLVYAVNGHLDSHGDAIYAPQIPDGTKLVRMGKACGELDVQTGRFNNLPTAEKQYCQNFMIQVEQSTFDKMSKKEVDWNFNDLEEDGIFDMRLAQENTYMWGIKNKIAHSSKDGMITYFTGGIWYMAGKDIEVGHVETVDDVNAEGKPIKKNIRVISDDDLVDIAKDMFVGAGIGNKRKIVFCGSEMLCALSKIKSKKFVLKDTVEKWNLKFKSWDTEFGEILTIHHELFDLNGKSDEAFALDPEFLSKKTFINWQRNMLDLKTAGVRNTEAVVLQEVACLYLRNPNAHARMKLVKVPTYQDPSPAA